MHPKNPEATFSASNTCTFLDQKKIHVPSLTKKKYMHFQMLTTYKLQIGKYSRDCYYEWRYMFYAILTI